MKKFLAILVMIASIRNAFGQKTVLNISIDEKFETLYSIAYLDNYFLISRHDNLYKQKLDKEFNQLRNHEAVYLFDTLSKKGKFNGYKIADWILQFGSFPDLEPVKKVAAPYPFTNDEQMLSEFKQALVAFHNDTLFQEYRNEVKTLNEQVIKQVKSSATIQELPTYLEEYYGKKLGSYNLLLSPFLHTGGFNSEMIAANGQKDVYAIIGPNGEIDFLPYFDRDYIETDMVLHEFGHSFVNPVTDQLEQEIEKLKIKYYTKALQETGRNNGYNEWKYIFNELLLRATTIKITERYFGKEKAKENLEEEKDSGFELVETIVKLLDEYEQNRAQYTTFDKFCPVLIERMK